MPIIIDSAQTGAARIGYKNLFTTAGVTVSVSSETTGYEKENAYDCFGYDWWRPDTLGVNWLRASFAAAKQVDYMAIWGHDLADHSASIKPQYSTDGGTIWQDAADAISPPDNDTILFAFDSVNAADWRVWVSAATTFPNIAGAQIGEALIFPHNMEIGFQPPSLVPMVELKTARSETGAFIGGSKKYEGIEGQFSFENLDPAWVRSEWIPFVNHAQTPKPFVFAWDSDAHGDEVVLGWVNKKISTPRYHDSLYMGIDLDFEGTV